MAEEKGFDEFARAVRDINKDFPPAMKAAAYRIANEWIQLAQGRAETAQMRAAASAMSAADDEETGATMRNDSPIFFGAEFGGQARPSTMQFPPHMGKRGYWLYPTAREHADEFQQIWAAGVDEAMKEWDNRKAGL